MSIIRITDVIGQVQPISHNLVSLKNGDSIILRGASFSYFGKDSNLPTLRNLNIKFPLGKLSLITGPTGAGKSSLLLALLGELELYEGYASIPYSSNRKPGTIAYVAQSAWLINTTVRDNILFGQEYDIERYHAVLEGCCLVNDLRRFEKGDLTMIGENGSLLSGGQKQRLSLARACYSKAHYVFIDDPLSAVDTLTARCLVHKCFLGLLKGRTVILVSNSIKKIIPYADYTVFMNGGKIIHQGLPEKLVRVNPNPKEQNLTAKERENNSCDFESNSDEDDNCTNYDVDISSPLSSERSSVVCVEKCFDENRYSNSSIFQLKKKNSESTSSFRYYLLYFKAAGGKTYFSLFIIFFLLAIAFKFASTWWIKTWTSNHSVKLSSVEMLNYPSTSKISPLMIDEQCLVVSQSHSHASFFILLYAILGVSNIVILYVREFIILFGNFSASKKFHFDLVNGIFRFPLRFFETTALGSIIGRFSEDISTVDNGIMLSITLFLNQFLHSMTIISVISMASPLFVLFAPLFFSLYCKILKEYRLKSRKLRKIENKTKSTIYTQFSEISNGYCTVRAYGYETALKTKMILGIDENHGAYLDSWKLNIRFCLITELMSSFAVFIVGVLVLFGDVNAASAALILNYSVDFTNTLCSCVKNQATLEMNIASVDRIQNYGNNWHEDADNSKNVVLDPLWPKYGCIEIKNLYARYGAELNDVLHGITIMVEPREKVAIVGKTGAGKSSISLALFQMIDTSTGSIIIDGQDISNINLEDLRSKLTIIPQEPILFSGNIRTNLDPLNQYSDTEIYESLQRVGYFESSESQPFMKTLSNDSNETLFQDSVSAGHHRKNYDLESKVIENGANISTGRRQLLCLARSLLQKNQIIILDEATASVDNETDAKIQNTIRTECFDRTVICISHRLRSIIDYDKVVVIGEGKVVELGSPLKLLENSENGIFRSMCEETGELEELFEMARRAWMK